MPVCAPSLIVKIVKIEKEVKENLHIPSHSLSAQVT